MASQKGAVYDVPDFHRFLVQCYAETERPWAAVEHLRAAKDEDLEAVDLARLAAKCKLPVEAARLYRIALGEEPARISLRMGLIVALNAAGERAQAAAERAQLFMVDGKFSKSKVQDYFHLLPNEGRAEEIVRTIRDFTGEPLTILVETTPVESRTSVLAEWERTVQDGRDWAQLGKLKRYWGTAEESLAVLKRGEALFPKDPWILRESIEGLAQAGEFKEAAAAYARLVEIDPDASKTGARPYPWLRRALEDLSLKDIATALPLATRLLAEPGLDEKEAQLIRAALRPGWDLSGADFWTQMKKTPFPKPPKALDQSLRTQIERLSSEEFNDRAAAFVELKKAGLAGIPVLLERIDDPDAEIRSRCREAIRAILTD
jgi:tetratricopeptide (TPR) repeat protein